MIALTAAKAFLARVPLPVWTGAAAALVMAIPLGVQTVRLSASQSEVARLTDRVERLSADLSTCRGNTATLEASIADQNAVVQEMARRASERIAGAEAAAQAARAERDDAQVRADQFMSRPIQGATACERVLDVDAAVLGDLGGQER